MANTQLSDSLRTFLDEPRFAVLATIARDGTPQLTTMWYELQGDEIMMNTADGRVKASNLRRDPRIAICFEDGYSYVTIYGKAELDDNQEVAQADIARLARRYHDAEQAEQMISQQFLKQRRVSIRMSIERVVSNA